MSEIFRGACSCRAVTVELGLPKTLENYKPRACDCDFCTERGISYLSDPLGSLKITSGQTLTSQTQGSEQAKFLTCPECRDVIAASIEIEGQPIGALNVCVVEDRELLQEAGTVSPKLLAPEQKVSRWQKVWLPIMIS